MHKDVHSKYVEYTQGPCVHENDERPLSNQRTITRILSCEKPKLCRMWDGQEYKPWTRVQTGPIRKNTCWEGGKEKNMYIHIITR